MEKIGSKSEVETTALSKDRQFIKDQEGMRRWQPREEKSI